MTSLRIIPFLICVFFYSCNPSKAPTRIDGIAMTIPYTVLIGDNCERPAVEKVISETFKEIDTIYNVWNPTSEVSRINRLGAHTKIELSFELASFLKRVDTLVHFTEGRFDPTVNRKGTLDSIGWHHIHLEEQSLWKDHGETSLDLSGVAKGYAVDLLLERISNLGFENVYVEWGGEIKACGIHPSQRKWRVEILGIPGSIELDTKAIATSGNYLQRWEDKGKIYTHIINPSTNTPVEITDQSVNSVSVLADTCWEADALATALMVFASRDAAALWAKESGIKIWIY